MYEKRRSAAEIETLITERVASMEESKQEELPEYAALLNELATLYRNSARLKEADGVYAKALDTLRELRREDTADYTDLLINRAGLLRIMDSYPESAALFRDAVKLLGARQPGDDETLARACGGASLSYLSAGDLKNAYKYALRAYELVSAGASGIHTLAESLNSLALIKYRMKDYDAAEKYAEEAVEIFDKLKLQSAQHSSAYATLASIKYEKLNFKDSRAAFEKAAELAEKYFGKNAEYVSIVSNLSTVCEILRDFKAALNAAVKAHKALRGLPENGGELKEQYRDRITRLKSLMRERAKR